MDDWKKATDVWREETLGPLAAKGQRPRKGLLAGGKDAQDLYTPADLEGVDLAKDIGFPGEAPFTRGVQANMYRGRLWTMRQYAGFGSAKATDRPVWPCESRKR